MSNFDEMMETFQQQWQGTSGEELPEVTEEPEAPVEPEEEPESPEEEDDDDAVDINGKQFTRAKLAELAQFDSYLNANPSVAKSLADSQSAVEQFYGRQAASVSPAVANVPAPQSQVPADLDLDDPGVKYLYEQNQALLERFQSLEQSNAQRLYAETESAMNRAFDDWNSRYHLSDEDLITVRNRAAELNIVPATMAQGRPAYDATTAALESAFWTIPDLRAKFLSGQSATQQSAAERSKKAKLSALSGKGQVNAPRVDPAQMSPEQRREAMAQEIAEHLARS